METLNNLADFLWVITKISFLSLILVVIILQILEGFLRLLLGHKRVKEDEYEWVEKDDENEEK